MALASRWRLIELKRHRAAVRGGIDLLDRKREALVRELTVRRSRAEERRLEFATALADARVRLGRAFDDLGRPACEAAALAQRSPVALAVAEDRVLGVGLPRIETTVTPFQISYGPGGTSRSLDRAAQAFAGVVPRLVDLASQESALRHLTRALRRTMRTLNALEDVLLPQLDAEIRSVADGLEEEERDERSRWSQVRHAACNEYE